MALSFTARIMGIGFAVILAMLVWATAMSGTPMDPEDSVPMLAGSLVGVGIVAIGALMPTRGDDRR